MLETLTNGFRQARLKLQGKAELSEDNISEALRDVRTSLLEADVEFGVVKRFLAKVKERSVGEVVPLKAKTQKGMMEVSPGDHFVKICHEELEALMGPVDAGINWATDGGPTVIMMVGLQGSGKTTTTAKLAKWVMAQGKRPLLVAADIYRPAAVQQLRVLGDRLGVPVFHKENTQPPDLATLALQDAKAHKRDVVILDTAGRLAIDEVLMQELEQVKQRAQPENIFFVCDAMIGQDAVKTAAEFNRRLEITGFILTKLDGDARGGAALSIKEVTGKPIKFLAMGEQVDKLEEFRPQGLASRILGMGDIVGLVKDFEQHVDEKKAETDATKMLQGKFNFDDFLEQMRTIKKMGSLQDLIERMPFFSDMLPPGFKIDDRELDRVEAMINSMTHQERQVPDILNDSRMKRIARGSGTQMSDVKSLIDRFVMARQMMGDLGRTTGLLSRLSGWGGMGKAAKGMPGLGGLGGMGGLGGLGGLGLGAGMPAAGGGGPLLQRSREDKAREKAKKKAAEKARKKNRRK